MIRLRNLITALAAAVSCVAIVSPAQSVMTHHVRGLVRNGQAQSTGRLPSNQVLQLDLVLPLRDAAGLQSFLKDLYNPYSPSYRQFLTPTEFTARFGATQAQYDTVVRFAKTYGLEVTGGSLNARDVQVTGRVANIEAAFHVNMRTYRHPTENREFYSPDSEPTMDLPFNLWHISGLDNYSIPHPLLVNKNDYAAAHGIDADKVVSHATTGSGPSASFLGSDMRAAYYGNGSLTGAGQSLGLWEFLGTDLADLNTYYSNVHQTNSVPITLLSTDGTSTSCVYRSGRCDDTEQTLDMTQALGMAPGLSSLVMYIGSSDTAIIGAMVSHNPLPTTIGCSWGWSPVDPSTLDQYFEQMASQGQNFFAASGDYSTWKSSGNAAAWPADDANVVSVGGTDLITASAAGPWQSETAWADSGGGISPDGIKIPTWQQLAGVITSSNKGSTTLRNGPDVAANANFTFYTCADQTTCNANLYGGTSFAAPMWAGLIALVNQQRIASSQGLLGFLNPTIYGQNVSGGSLSSAYAADFHDITSGTSGSYSAMTGYDLVTGWGSPNSGLVAALSGPAEPGFSLSGSAVTIAAGSSGNSTITSSVSGGFDGTVSLSASGGPAGTTFVFNPTSITGAGTSNLQINVPTGTTPGTYSVTVTGNDGTVQETTTVSVTVTGVTPGFSLSASPSSITIARSSSGTVSITSSITGGFSGIITLSASGEGNQNSVSFTPSSITGAGSSSMKITVGNRASTGTHTITVKGTSGSTSHTTTVTLTVIK